MSEREGLELYVTRRLTEVASSSVLKFNPKAFSFTCLASQMLGVFIPDA